MYIEIEGNSYFIYPKTDIDVIVIKKIADKTIHLKVPSQLPQDSLITYIKTQLPKKVAKYQKEEVFRTESINIFDKTFPIKFVVTDSPYILKGVINCDIRSVSSKSKMESLIQHLLLNHINNMMSTLEEELRLILPEIKLKKLKTKFYSNCHNTQSISYSKELIEKSLDFITYVVILSVGDFLKYTEDQLYYLWNKYVSDWKQCERIFKYEQQ